MGMHSLPWHQDKLSYILLTELWIYSIKFSIFRYIRVHLSFRISYAVPSFCKRANFIRPKNFLWLSSVDSYVSVACGSLSRSPKSILTERNLIRLGTQTIQWLLTWWNHLSLILIIKIAHVKLSIFNLISSFMVSDVSRSKIATRSDRLLRNSDKLLALSITN